MQHTSSPKVGASPPDQKWLNSPIKMMMMGIGIPNR